MRDIELGGDVTDEFKGRKRGLEKKIKKIPGSRSVCYTVRKKIIALIHVEIL